MIAYNLSTQKVGGQIEYPKFAEIAKSAEFFNHPKKGQLRIRRLSRWPLKMHNLISS